MRTLRGGSPKSRSHNVYQLNVIRDGQKKAVAVRGFSCHHGYYYDPNLFAELPIMSGLMFSRRDVGMSPFPSTTYPLTKIPQLKLNRLQRVLGRLKSISAESVAGKYCIFIQ